MVEVSSAPKKTVGRIVAEGNNTFKQICIFLTTVEQIKMQLLSKRVYEVVSNNMDTVEMPSVASLLEDKRDCFWVTKWTGTATQKAKRLFKIGENSDEISEKTLGFKECYF